MTPSAIRLCLSAGLIAFGMAATPALAQSAGNAAYQEFFGASVCGVGTSQGPPSEALLERCRDTFNPDAPEGEQFANISSSSESSLTPNQVSIAASSALSRARSQAEEAEKRLRELRDGEEDEQKGGDEGYIASFGPWAIFANIEAEWFDQSRAAFLNERGYDGRRLRGTLGADYRLDAGSHLGVMLHYEDNKATFDQEPAQTNFAPLDNAGSAKAETWSFTAFGTFQLSDRAWMDASAGMGWSDNDFRRNALFQNSQRSITLPVRTRGNANGKQYFASVGAGYDVTEGAWSYGPYVRGRWVKSKVDGYVEEDLSGSNLNLVVSNQKATSLTSVLGLRASYAASTGSGVILPQVRFEWEHEYKDDPRTTLTRFANDPRGTVTFGVTNDAPDRNYFNAGAGLVFVLPGGVMPFIDYEALIGYRNFTRHRVTAGLRLEF